MVPIPSVNDKNHIKRTTIAAEIVFRGCMSYTEMDVQDVIVPISNSCNKYVYIKQTLINPSHAKVKAVIPKVLVNPHFSKKVFVNPNFKTQPVPVSVPKIHVNPNVQKININGLSDSKNVQKIHINPNVLRNAPFTFNTAGSSETYLNKVHDLKQKIDIKTVSTLQNVKNNPATTNLMKCRTSIGSKFKFVKSSLPQNYMDNKSAENRRASIRSKYKIVKSPGVQRGYLTKKVNKFKVDNRSIKPIISLPKNKRYVYINRFLSVSDIAKNSLLKSNTKLIKSGLVNIRGIFYKKSPNCLRRTSSPCKSENLKKNEKSTCKSRFKFVKKSPSKVRVDLEKQAMMSGFPKVKKRVSPRKLRKCNIPCPYYRKYGRCKGKDNGKCYRKHDPDQIALCTKFLQGACIDEKCLLSHNVSPEKMPICKFYLEGSCSRDSCPYIHVRLNPKADICKDFLEGFCKKASECDKRHQFLCPDYEKSGNCLKQRCPYPHGKMVRKYSVFNKNKFAKKCSDCQKVKDDDVTEIGDLIGNELSDSNFENVNTKICEVHIRNRYYLDQNIADKDFCKDVCHSECKNSDDTVDCDQEGGWRSRPKLGKLPSFIALEETL